MDADMRMMQANWWMLTIRGIAALLFGFAALFWPGVTLYTLVLLFSAWILVDGVIRLVSGISHLGENAHGLLSMVVGFVELGGGVYLIRHPGITLKTFLGVIGFLLIINGVISVVASLAAKESATGKMLGIMLGVLAALAGIFMLMEPVSSGLAFTWILGLYGLITGPMLIAMSLDLHKMKTA
jgi:uncharacterized membrane protein HdeD (DUF308 family)